METVAAPAKATAKRPRPLGTAKPVKATAAKAAAKAKKPAAATALTVRRPKLIWRTRDQENSVLYNLQLDVASLQSELQGLRAVREMLMGRALNRRDDPDGSFVRTVREYFRVFRHGYAPDHQQPPRGRRAALPSSEQLPTPDEFLRHAMDEHVSIGRFAGLAQIMKQWERYSSVLGPMTLSFLDSQIIETFRGSGEGQDQVLVTSRAQYHLYISLRTVEIMFPHVLPHQEIVTKILGRRISGVGKFDFVFNKANNRIVRYKFSLDLTQSFVDLLGDPAMVAVLLKDALISDEFFIGDLSEFVPDRTDPSDAKEAEDEPARRTPENSDHVTPWKMTISSILSAPEDADEEDRGTDRDVAMEDSEPLTECSIDRHHAALNHHSHILRFEPV